MRQYSVIAKRDAEHPIQRETKNRDDHATPTEIPRHKDQQAQQVNADHARHIAPIELNRLRSFGHVERPLLRRPLARHWLQPIFRCRRRGDFELSGIHRHDTARKLTRT
jgi:hypothetical protein